MERYEIFRLFIKYLKKEYGFKLNGADEEMVVENFFDLDTSVICTSCHGTGKYADYSPDIPSSGNGFRGYCDCGECKKTGIVRIKLRDIIEMYTNYNCLNMFDNIIKKYELEDDVE